IAAATARRRSGARTLRQLWHDEMLPELQSHYEWMRALDVMTMPAAAAADAWADLWRRVRRIWVLHFTVTGSAYPVMEELAEAYAAATGEAGTAAFAIIAGLAPTLQQLEVDLESLVETARASGGTESADFARALASFPARLRRPARPRRRARLARGCLPSLRSRGRGGAAAAFRPACARGAPCERAAALEAAPRAEDDRHASESRTRRRESAGRGRGRAGRQVLAQGSRGVHWSGPRARAAGARRRRLREDARRRRPRLPRLDGVMDPAVHDGIGHRHGDRRRPRARRRRGARVRRSSGRRRRGRAHDAHRRRAARGGRRDRPGQAPVPGEMVRSRRRQAALAARRRAQHPRDRAARDRVRSAWRDLRDETARRRARATGRAADRCVQRAHLHEHALAKTCRRDVVASARRPAAPSRARSPDPPRLGRALPSRARRALPLDARALRLRAHAAGGRRGVG